LIFAIDLDDLVEILGTSEEGERESKRDCLKGKQKLAEEAKFQCGARQTRLR
jgi:hypothetical protein